MVSTPNAAAQFGQGGQKGAALAGPDGVPDGRAIDLDDVDVEHRKVLERRRAGPEIVDADPVTASAQGFDELAVELEQNIREAERQADIPVPFRLER
jgi:hypothetical protein